MKRVILILACVCFTVAGIAQAKKPTIMVVPSDVWCNAGGYTKTFDDMGVDVIYPDYDKALLNDLDLNLAISKIGEMMSERGFPLKDFASTLKSLKQQEIEESLTVSKSGDMLAETPLEKLNKVAKADIIIQLMWKVNKVGPQQSITFNMQGIDAYTNKQVAASSGTGTQSSFSEVPLLLENAVLSHIDQFNSQLETHFDDLFKNGREVSLVCRKWSGSEIDFESYVNDEELGVIIEDWIADNTIQGRFSTSDFSANRLVFEQVRMPLENEDGRAIDTRRWANELVKMLRRNYQIESKLTTKGLGQAFITIGEK